MNDLLAVLKLWGGIKCWSHYLSTAALNNVRVQLWKKKTDFQKNCELVEVSVASEVTN